MSLLTVFPFPSQELVLKNGSDIYEKWHRPPVVPHLLIYFFNVTNQEEFQLGSKPILEEVGPYCYRWVRHSNFPPLSKVLFSLSLVSVGSNVSDRQTFILYFFFLGAHVIVMSFIIGKEMLCLQINIVSLSTSDLNLIHDLTGRETLTEQFSVHWCITVTCVFLFK